MSKTEKIVVYLGDLVHTWEKTSTWMMPLNIGLVGSYALKQLGDDIEIRLFKNPEHLIEAIKTAPPDVLALSHYVWNVNLNQWLFEIAKKFNPEVLTVGGGPVFTVHNAEEAVARKFFNENRFMDSWVLDQGELGFVEALRAYQKSGNRSSIVRETMVPGCITVSSDPDQPICFGSKLDALQDLDEIPSPYLTGLMDPFFDMGLTPMIETNRSCPYRCTFCAFGIGSSKLTRYSLERVKADIDYISKHSTNSPSLFITDANFSILPRDVELAEYIYETSLATNWPRQVHNYWNKARPDRVAEVAKAFHGLAPIGASVQSLNVDTLGAIKRRNLPLDKIVEMFGELREFDSGLHLYSELIAGLPMETKTDHIEANRTLVDLGAEIQNYNLHLIPGTEMETKKGRLFATKTSWRLHDNAFGVYEDKAVFEGQEVVAATTTMPESDLHSLRFIHFIFQFMWGKRWYYDFLMFFKNLDVHPVDMMVRIAEEFPKDPGVMGGIHRAFESDHLLETFETPGDLFDYWRQPDNLERLRKGDYGKLNFQYSFMIDLEHRAEFNTFLSKIGMKVLSEKFPDEDETLPSLCKDIMRLCEERKVELDQELMIVESKKVPSNHDLAAWIHEGQSEIPRRADDDTVIEYELYLPPERSDMIRKLLDQYRSHNRNLTLRKMTEYTNPKNFLYDVREVAR
jgi:radical SAM superfamily enzyme YgiQ (UPF0313 family)